MHPASKLLLPRPWRAHNGAVAPRLIPESRVHLTRPGRPIQSRLREVLRMDVDSLRQRLLYLAEHKLREPPGAFDVFESEVTGKPILQEMLVRNWEVKLRVVMVDHPTHRYQSMRLLSSAVDDALLDLIVEWHHRYASQVSARLGLPLATIDPLSTVAAPALPLRPTAVSVPPKSSAEVDAEYWARFVELGGRADKGKLHAPRTTYTKLAKEFGVTRRPVTDRLKRHAERLRNAETVTTHLVRALQKK